MSKKVGEKLKVSQHFEYIYYILINKQNLKSMKKKPIFIVRFGIDHVVDVDRLAIGDLQLEEADILGCSLPIGIISIVTTDLKPSELSDRYSQARLDLNDHAPVIVWDPRSDKAHFNLVQDFPVVKDLIDEWEAHFDEDFFGEKNIIEKTCTMSLDELLDKISREGKESLSPLEFARLKSFSN